MYHSVAVAASVAIVSAFVAFAISRRVQPEVATRAITLLASLSAIATLWTLLVMASGNIIELHVVAERLSWGRDFLFAHHGTPIGAASAVAMLACVSSMVRVWARQHRLRAPAGHAELAIVPSDVPTAFALPGSPGQIVVSTGMLRSLEPDERRVLLAHERAHLRCHHHRYVRLTQLAAAAIPVLAPLNARVRYATERWADEEAVREVRDRAVVARAIARAALAQTDGVGVALGFVDAGVVERVESLLNEAPRPSRCFELGVAGVVVAAIGGLAASVVLVEPWVTHLMGIPHR